MDAQRTKDSHEVLGPWAEADPIPLKGISPRLLDLDGKRIGLFRNSKRASEPISAVVKEILQKRFPTLNFSSFLLMPNAGVDETDERERFDDWVKELDAVILSYGD
jgi:hypothetical protein